MAKNKYLALSAILLITLLISMVSANTFIVGIIEDASHVGLAGVEMNITCNYSGSSETKTTTSLSDGVYAIEFSFDGCDDPILVSSSVIGANITIINYIPEAEPACTNCGGGGGGSSTSNGHPTITYTPISTITETEEEEKETEETETPKTSWFTGAVTGTVEFAKTGLGMSIIFLVFVIAGTIAYFGFKKKNSDKTE